jgi:hypothetical protein
MSLIRRPIGALFETTEATGRSGGFLAFPRLVGGAKWIPTADL